MRRQQADRASAARDPQQQQPALASDGKARGNCARNGLSRENNQMDTPPTQEPRPTKRSNGDRDWSARIRASIARLMDIDGINLDPESYTKVAERKEAASQQAFHARVERLQAASEMAHKEYYSRLRDVYSASTAKKMRLSTSSSSPPPPTTTSAATWQSSHEALDTLAVAAATEQFNESEAPPKTKTKKKSKRSSRRQNPLPVEGSGGMSTTGSRPLTTLFYSGTERNAVAVHDPALAKAVDKLTAKMMELLRQLQSTSDAAAAEPILAAAASIALEATEMRRCHEVALTRMVEIEEHRQQIMQGLLEYAKRKEKRDDGSKEHASSASDARDNSPPMQDSSAQDTQAADAQQP